MSNRSFEYILDAWFLELPGRQVPSTRNPRTDAYIELFEMFKEHGFKYTDFNNRRKEEIVKRSVPQGHYPSGKKATWSRMCMEDVNSVLNVVFSPEEIKAPEPDEPEIAQEDIAEEEVVEEKSEAPQPEPLLQQPSTGVKLFDEDMEIILGYRKK